MIRGLKNSESYGIFLFLSVAKFSAVNEKHQKLKNFHFISQIRCYNKLYDVELVNFDRKEGNGDGSYDEGNRGDGGGAPLHRG